MAGGLQDGDTNVIEDQFGNWLNHKGTLTQATGALNGLGQQAACGSAIPGCQKIAASLQNVANEEKRFVTTVQQGLGKYEQIAKETVADYRGTDDVNAQTLQRGLNMNNDEDQHTYHQQHEYWDSHGAFADERSVRPDGNTQSGPHH